MLIDKMLLLNYHNNSAYHQGETSTKEWLLEDHIATVIFHIFGSYTFNMSKL